jgi:hypothetical protein
MSNKGKHLKTCPRVEERRPKAAAKALAVLVEGGSNRRAARASGLTHPTVAQLAERLPEDFYQIKKQRGEKHMGFAGRLLDSLDRMTDEQIDAIPPMSRSIQSGIHTDKAIACFAREIPMPFDPQLVRRVIEESEYWRNEMKRHGEEIPAAVEEESSAGTKSQTTEATIQTEGPAPSEVGRQES